MTVRHVIDTAAPPSREAIQGLVNSITSKIQQGQESICPTELKQLSSFFFHNNNDAINSIIPYLNRSLLQSGTIPHDGCVTLVRYRGMVQDVMDTEYYLCEVDGVKTKYREYYSSSSDSSNSTIPEEVDLKHNLKERQVLVVVPIPFANTDCIIPRMGEKTTDSDNNNNVSTNNDIMIMEQPQDKDESQGIGNNKKKRPLENSSSSCSNHDVPSTKQHQPNYRDRSPNSVVAANALNDWWPPACLGSDPNQCPVLAKFYNDNTPKLNQVVDMIGVLSMHPAAAAAAIDDLDGPTLPPPSLLPRLHVLVHKRMDLDLLVGSSNKSTTINTNMRLLAMETLSKSIFGSTDKDTAAAAAEAVLLTLHSLAERDAKGGQPLQMTEDTTLGCASLHLRTQNDKDCNLLWKRLQHSLQQLVPVVTTIDLSNPSSSLYKTPCKNNLDSSRLEPSILQLPKGAVVLVKFDDNDYNNNNNNNNPDFMDALRSLARSHVIPYKFEGGMVYPFEADVRVIVLSTIHQDCSLSCTMTCHVPTLGNDGTSNTTTTTSMEDTKQMAHYLASCRCTNTTNITLDKTVLKQAQQDFVNQRAQQRMRGLPEPAEEEFHLWLTMTRLLARSHGKRLATVQHWNAALRLYNAMNNIK